jgi:uncharacterized protein YbjT (DUF2867 family)
LPDESTELQDNWKKIVNKSILKKPIYKIRGRNKTVKIIFKFLLWSLPVRYFIKIKISNNYSFTEKLHPLLDTTNVDLGTSVLLQVQTFAFQKNRNMKIVLTGSLGHISKPLAQILIKKGHSVTVISSKIERQKDIESLGAKAAIGTMEDVDFLTETFTGADIVYLMEAIGAHRFFDQQLDYMAAINEIANKYKQAVQQSGVKRVVHLSSIGAHTNKGNGILAFHHSAENILKELPEVVSIKFMRPVGFYYNMLAFIPTIKKQDAIIQNYGGDKKEPWVSPLDIAAVIADEMEKPFSGRHIRYIASDEISPNEAAKILGEAIGKPGLKWQQIPDEQILQRMLAAGMNADIAKGMVEMNAGRRNDVLYEDYYKHRPALGKVKLTDFAKEFAAAYNSK